MQAYHVPIRSGHRQTVLKANGSYQDHAGIKHFLVPSGNDSKSSEWFVTSG